MDTRSVVRHHGFGDTGGCSGAIPVLCVTGDKGIFCCPPGPAPAQPAGFGMLRKALPWPSSVPGDARQDLGRIWGSAGSEAAVPGTAPCPQPGCALWSLPSPARPKLPRESTVLARDWCQPRALLCLRHSFEVFGAFCTFLLCASLESRWDCGV